MASPTSAIPLGSLSELHQAALRARQVSPATLQQYATLQRIFIGYLSERLGRAPTLADLTVPHAREFAEWLAGRRLAPATLHAYLGGLKVWGAFLAAEEDMLRANPLARLVVPKRETPLIEPLTPDEIGRMVTACVETHLPLRNRAAVLLLADTGLRVSELCTLALDALDYATAAAPGRAKVTGKGRKERLVYFGGKTSQALQRYVLLERPRAAGSWAAPRPELFLSLDGRPWTRQGVLKLVTALGKKAGVAGKRVSPHTLRHSYATEFLRARPGQSLQLQALLGHESLGTTRGYVHVASLDLQGTYASLVDGWKQVRDQAPRGREQAALRGLEVSRAPAAPGRVPRALRGAALAARRRREAEERPGPPERAEAGGGWWEELRDTLDHNQQAAG